MIEPRAGPHRGKQCNNILPFRKITKLNKEAIK